VHVAMFPFLEILCTGKKNLGVCGRINTKDDS
jgi:hypothetical protein